MIDPPSVQEDNKMTPLSIALIAFIGGGVVTGGTIWGISKAQQEQQDIDEIIKALEGEFEKAQAAAVVNLTEPDLLKVPCSAEYIEKHGDLLCREMFCRMNRQGGGQNSGGGPGAEASDCAAISAAAINALKVEKCMPYWAEGAGSDQNSQYWRCMTTLGSKP